MGSGCSSLHRLRKIIVISAYNTQPELDTVSERFDGFRKINQDGISFITRSDVIEATKLKSLSVIDDLLSQCNFDADEIPFHDFVGFLETGLVPRAITITCRSDPSTPLPGARAVYPAVWRTLRFCSVGERCSAVGVYRGEPPTLKRPKGRMWKKHETVIHEKIVKHLVVEENGTTQELIETEKNQSEIVHIECGDESARRERTEYEETSMLDKELASIERGGQEYIRLKSKNDEYEFLSDLMPTCEKETEAEVEARMRQEQWERRKQKDKDAFNETPEACSEDTDDSFGF